MQFGNCQQLRSQFVDSDPTHAGLVDPFVIFRRRLSPGARRPATQWLRQANIQQERGMSMLLTRPWMMWNS